MATVEIWIKHKTGIAGLQRSQLLLIEATNNVLPLREKASSIFELRPLCLSSNVKEKNAVLPLKGFRKSPILSRAVCEQSVAPSSSLQGEGEAQELVAPS